MSDKWEQYRADNYQEPEDKWEQYNSDKVSKKKKPINYKEFLQEGYKSFAKGAERLGKNIAVGVTEGGRNIANIPHNLARLMGSGKYVPNLAPEDYDYAKAYGLEEPANLSDKLIRGFAQYAPSLALPGANIGRAGEAIGAIPKIGSFLQGAAEQAIPQAAFGATQNKNPLAGAAEGGIGSVLGSAIGKGLEYGINALRPSQLYKSPLSKKELATSFRQAEGTNTDLGNVIENPKLQRLYENKLPKLSGETSLMQQKTGQQIVDKGESILKKLLGSNSAENVPAQLTKTLTDSFTKHQKFKNDIYNAVDDLAQKENLKLNLGSFADEAKKYMSAIEDTNILKHEPDAKMILNKLMNYKNPVKETKTSGLIVDKSGKPILEETKTSYPTLKEANILKGKLGQYAKTFARSPDPSQRNMANIFGNLSRKLKSDIKTSIDQSGSAVLKQGYQTAEENYAKNFSPFLDKDIYKFVSGNADPETLISKFITRSNTSDLGQKLSKLAEKLSKPGGKQGSEQSNLLAYGYLSRALDNEGNFNPAKFATSIKNLGPNQLKALFPDKAIRKEVLNYKALVNKNTRSLNAMFNPLTGQVNSDIAPHALAKIVGGLSGLATGGTAGAVIGSVAAPVINKKIADFATKKLTDPAYRRKFINALIAKKQYEIPKTKEALQKGGALIGNTSGEDSYNRPLELEVIGKRDNR